MSNNTILSYLHLNKSNDKLIIFFSSYTTKVGKFDFYKVGNFLLEEGYDILFCADYSQQWYLNGISGLGNSIEETTSSLRKISSPYKHVTCIGGSMGGYGSILFGTALGADIVSFGSDIILKAPMTQSLRRLSLEIDSKYSDVQSLFNAYNGKAFLYVGELDHSDLYYSSLLDNHEPKVSVRVIRNCFHSIPIFLNELKLTESFILELLKKRENPVYPFIETYSQLNLDYTRLRKIFDYKNELATGIIIEKHNITYLSLFYKAYTCWSNKEYHDCLDILRESLSLRPSNIQTMLFMAMAYREIQEFEKSLLMFKAIENICLIPFVRMFFEFGILQYRISNFTEAIYYFSRSIEENYNYEQSKKLLMQCYKKIVNE